MECNKEEAERCIAIGKRALEQGDYERALKFFTKVFFVLIFSHYLTFPFQSHQLFNSQEAEDLIKAAHKTSKPAAQENSAKVTSPNLRRRKPPQEDAKASSSGQ